MFGWLRGGRGGGGGDGDGGASASGSGDRSSGGVGGAAFCGREFPEVRRGL